LKDRTKPRRCPCEDEQGLEQELPDDRPPPGPDRKLDADLLRPLLGRRVHEVGDADGADEERQRAMTPRKISMPLKMAWPCLKSSMVFQNVVA